MLLAIDTATRWASIALYDGQQVLAEHSWYSRNHHTAELMPHIAGSVTQQGLAPQELTAVAVAIGPGSFTSLRIGLSVAKGLCLALSVPLLGISTLDAVAYAQSGQPLPVCAVIRAGRGRICTATYQTRRGRWQRLCDHRLTTWESLIVEVERRTLFCGELDAEAIALLREHLALRAVLASPASCLRRAGYLAELGWQRFQAGEADDAVKLAPLYLQTT